MSFDSVVENAIELYFLLNHVTAPLIYSISTHDVDLRLFVAPA